MKALLVAVSVVTIHLPPVLTTSYCSSLHVPTCLCTSSSNEPSRNVELKCNNNLTVKISLGRSVQFSCSSPSSELSPPADLHLGDVEGLVIECPLYNASVHELMTSIGTDKIKWLHLKSFQYVNGSLNRHHFENLSMVTKLYLKSVGLTSLPADLFYDMVNITELYLTFNSIESYPVGLFSSMTKLKKLESGGNKLAYLKPGIFRNLYNLELLNLWANQLRNLTRAVFSDLISLKKLDLGLNNIEFFEPNIFEDLSQLKVLNLNSNAFSNLPAALLSKNNELVEFRMNGNSRYIHSLPSKFLGNLNKLTRVDLSNSRIIGLTEDVFSRSNNIKIIHLNKNLLNTLKKKSFHDLEELEYLDLSYNHITNLPEQLFSKTNKLKTLLLQFNYLTTIAENLFESLQYLEVINLHSNHIKQVFGQQFRNQKSLKTLIISNNKLTTFTAKMSASLQNLQLSNNSLSMFNIDWKWHAQLQILKLAFNNITHFPIYDLKLLPGGISIDLSNNGITQLDFSEAGLITQHNKPIRIKMDNNPFNCDCKLHSFVQFIKNESIRNINNGIELHNRNLMCNGPKELKSNHLTDIDLLSLLCELDKDSETNCPKGCVCFERPVDKATLIKCSGLSVVPQMLPQSPNSDHIELHLRGNYLPNLEIDYSLFENVTHFYLPNNSIEHVNIIGDFKKIEVLDVSDNNLSTLPENTIQFLEEAPNLRTLVLQGNPWQCDCGSKSLVTMIRNRFKQVMNPANISCSDSDGSSLDKILDKELCLNYFYIFLLSFFIFAVILAILTALCFHYQTQIAIYCYSSRWTFLQRMVSKPEGEDDKMYDAFISFSHDDEQFVSEILVPELEQKGERKYKLCVHYRDWTPGRMITTQIFESIQNSRRTIVVLSPGFLNSVWGPMEFKTAYAEGLCNGETKVVVVLYKDIGPIEQLDQELAVYLMQNTYVRWGSPWFWQQLYYALPHHEKDTTAKYSNSYFSKKTKHKRASGIDLSERSNNIDDSGKQNKINSNRSGRV